MYAITVRATDGARVYGLIGLKGPVIGGCEIGSQLTEQPADPPRYWWPYLLFRPTSLTSVNPKPSGVPTLLVAPNNSGWPIDDVKLLRASAKCELRDSSILGVADGLGTPVLMPLFPRPELPE